MDKKLLIGGIVLIATLIYGLTALSTPDFQKQTPKEKLKDPLSIPLYLGVLVCVPLMVIFLIQSYKKNKKLIKKK